MGNGPNAEWGMCGIEHTYWSKIVAIVSLVTGRMMPRSQMMAVISRAGVTSKAGL